MIWVWKFPPCLGKRSHGQGGEQACKAELQPAQQRQEQGRDSPPGAETNSDSAVRDPAGHCIHDSSKDTASPVAPIRW